MNAQVKTKPDDTRARIMETADALFRRLGFAKTAVADIAAELGMSPANVYRFFPSKNAIVEAICQRCLADARGEGMGGGALARAGGVPRCERLVLEILAYHRENLLADQRVNDIVLVAMEHSWNAIEAHKEAIRGIADNDPARRHRGRRVRAGRPARDRAIDHARADPRSPTRS